MAGLDVTIVVPTIARPQLAVLGASLRPAVERLGCAVLVVDDRPPAAGGGKGALDADPLDGHLGDLASCATVLASGGRGPAAARNVGWRAARTEWVAFLDDDVVLPDEWAELLSDDLVALEGEPLVGASQGRIRVPLPAGRPPGDWERNVAGLEHATWATADMAYRRAVLEEVGGFDERFERAYREDADLGLRVTAAGYLILLGRRHVRHPVRPAGRLVSLGLQRGNADDVLMRAIHGRTWRLDASAGPGRNRLHAATVVSGLLAGGAGVLAAADLLAGAGVGRARSRARLRALVTASLPPAGVWLALSADFARRRIAPGPKDPAEVAAMVATSVAIPFAAAWHAAAGVARLPRLLKDSRRAPLGRPAPRGRLRRFGTGGTVSRVRQRPPLPPRAAPTRAILFDRDGTVVFDEPYNGDPERVVPVPGARAALAAARQAGVAVGLVTNQSGVARGLLTPDEVDKVNDKVGQLLGPFDAVAVCPHGVGDGCACRKPAPGLVLQAATQIGVLPEECVVIGDIGADVAAARAAGAVGILVPTAQTRRREITRALHSEAATVAADLPQAVALALTGCAP